MKKVLKNHYMRNWAGTQCQRDTTVILCSTPFGRSRLGFLIFPYLLRKEKNQKTQPNYCPYLDTLSFAWITRLGFNLLSLIYFKKRRAITA